MSHSQSSHTGNGPAKNSYSSSNNQNTLHPSDIVSQHTEQQIEYKLHQAIMAGNLQEMKNVIEDSGVLVHATKDQRQYTVLHRACLNSQNEISKYIVEKVKEELQDTLSNNSHEKYIEYLNAQTNEGFTGLHFASFKGDIETLDLLIQEGADTDIHNLKQVNMVHIAAQGDQPISLAYFKSRGLDLNKKDGKGSTPLHWAAYLASENAVNFLSSWDEVDLNAQDIEGELTPLHLAVMSGNSKVVHKLLIRGADKHIQDRDCKTPRDLAIENEYNNIAMILEDETIMEKCTKTGTFKEKPKKSRKFLFGFQFILIMSQVVTYFFLLPYIDLLYLLILQFGLFGLVAFFFLISWLKNPGYLKKKRKQSLLTVLSKIENFKVCPDCEILKPKRSKHCEICQSCVKVFDHHCPWINNCVGAGNHAYFICFITFLLFFFAYEIGFCIYSKFYITHLLISLKIVLMKNKASFSYVSKWYGSNNTYINDDLLLVYKYIVTITILIVSAFFVFPILQFMCFFMTFIRILVRVQLSNFGSGQTTQEKYGYKARLRKIREERSTKSKLSQKLISNNDDNHSNSFTLSQITFTQDYEKKKQNCCLNCIDMAMKNKKNKTFDYSQV